MYLESRLTILFSFLAKLSLFFSFSLSNRRFFLYLARRIFFPSSSSSSSCTIITFSKVYLSNAVHFSLRQEEGSERKAMKSFRRSWRKEGRKEGRRDGWTPLLLPLFPSQASILLCFVFLIIRTSPKPPPPPPPPPLPTRMRKTLILCCSLGRLLILQWVALGWVLWVKVPREESCVAVLLRPPDLLFLRCIYDHQKGGCFEFWITFVCCCCLFVCVCV